jgi:hypothetical protein
MEIATSCPWRRKKIQHRGQEWSTRLLVAQLFPSSLLFSSLPILYSRKNANACPKPPSKGPVHAKFNKSVTANDGTKSRLLVESHLTLWAIGRVPVKRHAMPSRRARTGVATCTALERHSCAPGAAPPTEPNYSESAAVRTEVDSTDGGIERPAGVCSTTRPLSNTKVTFGAYQAGPTMRYPHHYIVMIIASVCCWAARL